MTQQSNEVAKIILSQLGGWKFPVFTGAKDLTSSDYEGRGSLSFRLNGKLTKGRINHVKIVLTYDDLYDITFTNIHGSKITQRAKFEGIYSDMLQETFEITTGLCTSL